MYSIKGDQPAAVGAPVPEQVLAACVHHGFSRKIGGKPTAQRPRKRAPSALPCFGRRKSANPVFSNPRMSLKEAKGSDGEDVYLRLREIALIAIPHWMLNPDMLDEVELDESGTGRSEEHTSELQS